MMIMKNKSIDKTTHIVKGLNMENVRCDMIVIRYIRSSRIYLRLRNNKNKEEL